MILITLEYLNFANVNLKTAVKIAVEADFETKLKLKFLQPKHRFKFAKYYVVGIINSVYRE